MKEYFENHEVLMYIGVAVIAAALIALSFPISNAILDGAEQNARKYQTALQTRNDKEFNYSIDTKQSNVLAPITVHQVDTVKFPEMNKSFPYVEKTTEEYTRHEREVCENTYNSKGDVTGETCHTEVDYSWDYDSSDSLQANEVQVAGRNYPYSMFNVRNPNSVDAKDIIDGQEGHYVYQRVSGGFFGRAWLSSDTEGDKRTSYRVGSLPVSGTIFANMQDGLRPVNGSVFNLESKSPQELVEAAKGAANVAKWAFRVAWWVLVLGVLAAGVWFVATFDKRSKGY